LQSASVIREIKGKHFIVNDSREFNSLESFRGERAFAKLHRRNSRPKERERERENEMESSVFDRPRWILRRFHRLIESSATYWDRGSNTRRIDRRDLTNRTSERNSPLLATFRSSNHVIVWLHISNGLIILAAENRPAVFRQLLFAPDFFFFFKYTWRNLIKNDVFLDYVEFKDIPSSFSSSLSFSIDTNLM